MYDPSSAFTHDDLFESSIELDDVPPVAINAEVIPDSVPASDNAIQHHRSDIPATESCGMTSVETDQNANPHRETPEDTTRPRESDIANAAPEEVTVQRSEPETRGQKEIVEPSTEIPSISRIKIEDLGTETIQDPLRAPTVGECSMEAAACRDENTGGDVFTAGKAVPSDAKSTVNEPVVEAASDDGNGNIAPDAIHRPGQVVHLLLEDSKDEIDSDIRFVIRHRLERIVKRGTCKPLVRDTLEKMLVTKADQTFL